MENDYKSNVARKNYERIDILVHGALSIPNNYIKLSKTYVKWYNCAIRNKLIFLYSF